MTLKEKIEREISLAHKKLALVEEHPDMEERAGQFYAASAAPWCGLFRFDHLGSRVEVVPYYRPDPDLMVHGGRFVVLVFHYGWGESRWRAQMVQCGYRTDLIDKVAEEVQRLLEAKE